MPSDFRLVESGAMGRVAYARIAPNEDLVQSVEKLCLAQGFRNAFVRGALGSLVDACLSNSDGSCLVIRGPAAEIVSLAGEVRAQSDGSLQASLTGVVVASCFCSVRSGAGHQGFSTFANASMWSGVITLSSSTNVSVSARFVSQR